MTDLHSVLRALADPFLWLIRPSERVFWPFLLSAALIAATVLVAQGGGRSPSRLIRRLLSKDTWLHRSALLDYQLMFVKAVFRVALFAPWLVTTFGVAAVVVGWLRAGLGTAPSTSMSSVQVGLLFTVATFLGDDLSRYMVHRWMHRVPVLWECHKVHHSARVLTPFTLFRSHPVETFLNGVRGSVAIGTVTGVFYWLFGARVQGWQVLGVDAVGFVWTFFGANLRHSNVWVSYGPQLEHVLNSPAQHQIHHSDDPRHFDRNFGEVLSIWDWMGGSLYVTRSTPEQIRFGLPAGVLNHGDGVLGAVFPPAFGAVRVLAHGVRRLAPASAAGLLAVLGAAGLAVSGCDTTTGGIDRPALLRSFGECALSTYKAFEAEAAGLAGATEAAAASPASKSAAQEAWRRAIDTWQQAELMQFGPAAAPPALGGQNLRASIYSWPDVNRCLIEQQIVARTYEDVSQFAAAPSTTRGLGAVEYLLSHEASDNACPATASINAAGTWMALSAEEVSARKAAYAAVAAADVAAKANALVEAWEPGEGDFVVELATAGAGSRVYATQSAALNAVSDALFYLEVVVKDRKLAPAVGLRDCATQTCPEALESTWADRAKQHLSNNLLGFQRLIVGCSPGGEGLAFDDLLGAAGAGSVANEMKADIAAANAAIDRIADPSLSGALASDRDAVVRVHDAVKAVTDVLKNEFVLALEITVPGRVSGDHD